MFVLFNTLYQEYFCGLDNEQGYYILEKEKHKAKVFTRDEAEEKLSYFNSENYEIREINKMTDKQIEMYDKVMALASKIYVEEKRKKHPYIAPELLPKEIVSDQIKALAKAIVINLDNWGDK